MIVWTIRLACIFYCLALAQIIRRRPARVYWTIGCAFYLAHVAAAFHYVYHWSHSVAVQETARQTQAIFGMNWGGGVWFNYAFTVIWSADAFWWLAAPKSRAARSAWLNTAIHSYLAWMFINGAIVFPTGPTRWVAAAAAVVLLLAKVFFPARNHGP